MSDTNVVKEFARRVGMSTQEAELIAPDDSRARHIKRLAEASSRYSIQAEVVSSVACNTGYRPGDRFVLDVDGNFISKLCPKRLCVYLVGQLTVPVALINERLSEGLDPNQFHFMRQVNCTDCGVQGQGYGQVRLKVSVKPRS
ncbi:MAG: hypothetical protein K9K65_15470 [Desulfarculaceae bacterium]|nr:hypothetical protein [Desulfarculaceae bacterium]MCF8049353.1 hypothetical protein [Desulfarculaceae bacterium]MCF8099237.1 hypothetical protein [Desulfarculaceae bacterium]MCF8124415.1 hypothetical protein [Desulfarculaceae bacterium]